MSGVLSILFLLFLRLAWIVVLPTDLMVLMLPGVASRMNRGWVRRRIIRRYGPAGLWMCRWKFWSIVCIPGLSLVFAHQYAGQILCDLYWLILGAVNGIDFITSWDDPPWRKARRWASERIQKLLENMGERSRVPQPVPIPR